MSKSAEPTNPSVRPGRRWPGLGTIAGVSLLLLAIGGGTHYLLNATTTQTSDDDQDDELAFLEDQVKSGQPRRLASAMITDVMTAGHEESESDSDESNIIPTGYTAGSRPPSNPSIWLVGTIEAEAEPEASAVPMWQQDNPSRVR